MNYEIEDVPGTGGQLKRFADSRLQQSIRAAVDGLAPDERIAVIGFADAGAVRGAIVTRIGKHWSAVAVASHSLKGDGTEFEVAVKFSA